MGRSPPRRQGLFRSGAAMVALACDKSRALSVAGYAVLGMIAIIYAGAGWAMATHNGDRHVVAAALRQAQAP